MWIHLEITAFFFSTSGEEEEEAESSDADMDEGTEDQEEVDNISVPSTSAEELGRRAAAEATAALSNRGQKRNKVNVHT